MWHHFGHMLHKLTYIHPWIVKRLCLTRGRPRDMGPTSHFWDTDFCSNPCDAKRKASHVLMAGTVAESLLN